MNVGLLFLNYVTLHIKNTYIHKIVYIYHVIEVYPSAVNSYMQLQRFIEINAHVISFISPLIWHHISHRCSLHPGRFTSSKAIYLGYSTRSLSPGPTNRHYFTGIFPKPKSCTAIGYHCCRSSKL